MNEYCLNCINLDLKKSKTRNHGYGHCKAELDEVTRMSKLFSVAHTCHLGRFKQASDEVIANREKGLG